MILHDFMPVNSIRHPYTQVKYICYEKYIIIVCAILAMQFLLKVQLSATIMCEIGYTHSRCRFSIDKYSQIFDIKARTT